jgi:outer membrane cobalamin receptor
LSAAYRYTGSRFDSGYDFTLGPYGALKRLNVESYHLVDVGVDWQATKVLGIGIKVENVLDESYREIAGFQTRGRSAFVKLTARW